ncbi:hypothetical protein HWV62_25040 [Athelia sp. TMB]|nr:hypothetical protein HWV62_25040 [Athelia sp. TMB]
MSGLQSVQKDVSDEVMSKTPRFAHQDAPDPGPDSEVVYCHDYTKEILNFDNWDFMFLSKHCCKNGVTMHEPETPPRRILDIGTGNGLWAIEAAKLWKDIYRILRPGGVLEVSYDLSRSSDILCGGAMLILIASIGNGRRLDISSRTDAVSIPGEFLGCVSSSLLRLFIRTDLYAAAHPSGNYIPQLLPLYYQWFILSAI